MNHFADVVCEKKWKEPRYSARSIRAPACVCVSGEVREERGLRVLFFESNKYEKEDMKPFEAMTLIGRRQPVSSGDRPRLRARRWKMRWDVSWSLFRKFFLRHRTD